MRGLSFIILPVVLMASPALAQHHDHSAHQTEAKPQADPHAGHAMPDSKPAEDDHLAHAGHVMPAAVPDGLASGPRHAADLYFDPAQMAEARRTLLAENGDVRVSALRFDRLEGRFGEGQSGYGWEVDGYTGGDINRFWWKSDGEGEFGGRLHQASVQALYSRAVAPFWDLQAGVKQEYRDQGPNRTHLALGVQGTAPYWFEVSGQVFLSTKGDLTASAEADYDLRLTQKWILKPVAHLALSAQDVPELELGSGVTSVSAGLLLRYEIRREFAPYVGIEWEGAMGRTADLIRARGGEADQTRFVVGLKTWF